MKIVSYKENRWKIVNDNDETLDDAQGYGFTSKKAAQRCWDFKQNKNYQAVKEFKRNIENWWYENKNLYDYISDEIWIGIHDRVPLKQSEIVELTRTYMQEHDIKKPDGLHTWQLVKYMWY